MHQLSMTLTSSHDLIFTLSLHPIRKSLHRFYLPLSKLISTKSLVIGEQYGLYFYRRHRWTMAAGWAFHLGLRDVGWCNGRAIMSAFYIVGAVVSVALLVYLVVALFKAEDL
jgi:K+-transporting ATPase KdpF subunit